MFKSTYTINKKGLKSKWSPVKTAQPAAAASEMLWPVKPGKNEPPITATGDNPYKSRNSPTNQKVLFIKGEKA